MNTIGPTTRFSDGVALTKPNPISHNVNRAKVAAAAGAKAAKLKESLSTISVTLPGTPKGPTSGFAKPPSAAKL
jgi:hypothetical protein